MKECAAWIFSKSLQNDSWKFYCSPEWCRNTLTSEEVTFLIQLLLCQRQVCTCLAHRLAKTYKNVRWNLQISWDLRMRSDLYLSPKSHLMHIVEEASHMSYTRCICHRPMARNKEPVFTSSLPKSSNESKTSTLTRISLVHFAFTACIFKQKTCTKYTWWIWHFAPPTNHPKPSPRLKQVQPSVTPWVSSNWRDTVFLVRFAEAPHHWGDTDEEQVPRIANAALRQQQHRVLVKFSKKMFPFQKNPLKNFFGSTQTQGVPTLTYQRSLSRACDHKLWVIFGTLHRAPKCYIVTWTSLTSLTLTPNPYKTKEHSSSGLLPFARTSELSRWHLLTLVKISAQQLHR